MVALPTVWYSFGRIDRLVKMAAVAAGVSQALWTTDDSVASTDAAAPAARPRGPDQKAALGREAANVR